MRGLLRALRKALGGREYDVVHAQSPHVAFLLLVGTLLSRRIPLAPPDHAEGFARELKRFREMSATIRQEIGEKWRRFAVERFGLGEMERGYEVVFFQVRSGT